MAENVPERMRAAVYKGDRRVEVEDYPLPPVGADDVLLEISHCGVCGSDIHFVLEGWGRPNSVGGHEFTGTVAQVGANVRDWKVGDQVVGGPTVRCGECEFCRAGRPNLCVGRGNVGEGSTFQGAFADYMRVPQGELLRLPDGVSLRHAALTEPLAVALHGITRSGVRPGDRVLVTGGGPIGSLSIAALVHRGIEDIVLSEPSEVRRELGTRLGARTIRPEELHVPASPNELVDEPFHAVLECSGSNKAMEVGLAQLRRTGTLVLVGAGMRFPRLDPNRILLNELSITGAFCYDADGFERSLEMLAAPRFPRDLLIEPDDVGLSGLLGAIEQLGAGTIPAKVLVAPHRDREGVRA
ncbi:MAG TPA: alcohol dehydrogenase catalytic domain-containing protein [Acidimicrobiia bacterium]|jgi:(R,R)-butanediol dehydrogenase/meso-butanediol dehydrogenase/diacetyl reductase